MYTQINIIFLSVTSRRVLSKRLHLSSHSYKARCTIANGF